MPAYPIRPIRTAADHDAAVARLGELWGAEPGSDEDAELDALATLIDAYEQREIPVPAMTPLETLRYAIDEMGRSQGELASLLGSASRASEILKGKRAMTLAMIRTISREWKIPLVLLVGEGDTSTERTGRSRNHRARIARKVRKTKRKLTSPARARA